MIIDHCPPIEGVAPKVSDPILQELDCLSDDAELLRVVRQDLQRHYSGQRHERPLVPVEVTLRLIILRRRKKVNYAEVEARPVPPPDLCYAVAVKEREKGRVVEVTTRLVYGTTEQVEAALRTSPVSQTLHTSDVERNNLTIAQLSRTT